LNDAFAVVDEIRLWKEIQIEMRHPADRPKITTSFKVDKFVEMGIVTDCKQELRKGKFLKINYSAIPEIPY